MQRTRSTSSSPTRRPWRFLTFLQVYRLSLHVPFHSHHPCLADAAVRRPAVCLRRRVRRQLRRVRALRQRLVHVDGRQLACCQFFRSKRSYFPWERCLASIPQRYRWSCHRCTYWSVLRRVRLEQQTALQVLSRLHPRTAFRKCSKRSCICLNNISCPFARWPLRSGSLLRHVRFLPPPLAPAPATSHTFHPLTRFTQSFR